MRLLRTLAVASTSAVLLTGQAVAAFACEQHQTTALDCPGPLGHSQIPEPRPSPRRPAIRSWPILLESPASPSRRWAPWECTTSTVIW